MKKYAQEGIEELYKITYMYMYIHTHIHIFIYLLIYLFNLFIRLEITLATAGSAGINAKEGDKKKSIEVQRVKHRTLSEQLMRT